MLFGAPDELEVIGVPQLIQLEASSSQPPSNKYFGKEVLSVKRLSETATIPTRGSKYAAGYDLYSAKQLVVPAKGKALVPTDISIAIPENTYARIAPRSGLAWKKFIDVGAGVVDYDYRGPVGVVLFNHGDEDLIIEIGDRIAQLILERICMADVEEVEELPDTERGSGGFGSTGVKKEESQKSEEDNSDETDKENKRHKPSAE